jgi:hypothetical protein
VIRVSRLEILGAAIALLLTACTSIADPLNPAPKGAPFPMPNSPSSGLPHPQSYFVDDARDLVFDQVTGLAWQRHVDRGPGQTGGFVWADAVAHCDGLVQGGFDDFYLPSRLELVTVVDPGRFDPAIDLDAFPETPPDAYWTASPVATDSEQFFHLNLFFGYTSSNFRVYEQFVRCARNARRPELPTNDRFRVEGSTVVDRMTGLRWERSPPSENGAAGDAASRCDALAVDGHDDFRLPSMKELQTLVDETRTDVTIDLAAFPETEAGGYWSSTRDAQNPESAWFVRFSDGYAQSAAETEPFFGRCVR